MKNKPTKKHYEIVITAFATVIVENAESEEKAYEYATDALNRGDMQFDEGRIKRVLTDTELPNAKKYADAVAESEEDDE